MVAGIAPNVNVKVPLIAEGIKLVKKLSEEGIKTNVTLCFTPVQALCAAKVGATYISPFVGRLDESALKVWKASATSAPSTTTTASRRRF
jgi:transaldolase